MTNDITRPRIIENARRAFLDACTDRRIAFARDSLTQFKLFCHEPDYKLRWPDEALRLAEAEVNLRNQELKARLSAAIAAGWKPSPDFSVEHAVGRCLSYEHHNENPTSDLYAFVVGAFDRVGRPISKDEERHQRAGLGAALVRGCNISIQYLEAIATAKYGDYRQLEYNEESRKRTLEALNEHFLKSTDLVNPAGALQLLNIENNQETRRVAGLILKYWIDENAVSGKSIRTDDGSIHANVTSMTSKGTKIAEGRSEQPVIVQYTYNFRDSTVAVAGPMTGGIFTQNVGGSFSDLAVALEELRNEMARSDEALASVAEAAAKSAAELARAPQADKNAIGRALSGLGQIIQAISATPQAWAFIVAEAGRAGFNLPELPS